MRKKIFAILLSLFLFSSTQSYAANNTTQTIDNQLLKLKNDMRERINTLDSKIEEVRNSARITAVCFWVLVGLNVLVAVAKSGNSNN